LPETEKKPSTDVQMNMNTTNNQKNSLASLSNLDLVYVAWLLSDDYFDPKA